MENENRLELINMQGIIKRYYEGAENELEILHGIDLSVKDGEFLSIVGESGSGKSTLMNIVGILDRPSEGSYLLEGKDVSALSDEEQSKLRNQKIGFVFQSFYLMPRISALRNVEVPLMYAGIPEKRRRERARELLNMVGMSERENHKPTELSGGQNQRVAIARAMANDPAIILADEPTGALDTATGHMVMDIFHRLHEEYNKTIVLITHSPELANETERILSISDGMIVGERHGSGRSVR